MDCVLTAPGAVLLQFQPSLKGFLVLLGMVVHVLANRAFEINQVVLGHNIVSDEEMY